MGAPADAERLAETNSEPQKRRTSAGPTPGTRERRGNVWSPRPASSQTNSHPSPNLPKKKKKNDSLQRPHQRPSRKKKKKKMTPYSAPPKDHREKKKKKKKK